MGPLFGLSTEMIPSRQMAFSKLSPSDNLPIPVLCPFRSPTSSPLPPLAPDLAKLCSKYPSTPSRIQISIWPAGISTSAQGTIDWAGGLINWQDPDYTTNGYFWNTVQSVDVTCATDGSISSGTTGYMYLANNMSSLPVRSGRDILSL